MLEIDADEGVALQELQKPGWEAACEKITEALSTAIFSSTEKSTAAKETSVRTTASETTVAATQGRTLPFTIPVPTIQIPDFRPETTTAAPITKPINGEYDSSCFDSTVFIGNSRFISFKNYGLAKNVYAVVGLNVDTVFTKTVAGSTVTVIDELNGKDFEKVVLMFGDNECGWSSYDSFVVKYSINSNPFSGLILRVRYTWVCATFHTRMHTRMTTKHYAPADTYWIFMQLKWTIWTK